MADAFYLKGPAILVRNSDGLAISTTDGITIDQSVKTVEVGQQFGGPLTRWTSGIEHTITLTPHGILDATRISALFPFLYAAIGSRVYTDQSWTIYGQDGFTRTYHNMAIKTQPTMDVGIDKPNVLGQVTFGALHAKSGGHIGELYTNGTAAFPGFSFVNIAGLFHAGAKLSWFVDRTVGMVSASGTLTSDATNVTDADTVVIGALTYRLKTVLAQANDVQIGVDAATTLANLKKAINATGVAGTHYYAGTLAHPTVIAGTLTSTTLLVTSILGGTGGNAIVTTEASTHLGWGAGTLTGGVDGQAAANAVGYVADPADAGWYQSRTSDGIKITPTAKLQLEPNSEYGGFGNYTLSETGVEIDGTVIDVTEAAYDKATSQTIGATLEKGDVLIVAGISPNQLRVVATRCGFTGGTKMWHKDNKRLGPAKFESTSTFENGVQLPHCTIAVV